MKNFFLKKSATLLPSKSLIFKNLDGRIALFGLVEFCRKAVLLNAKPCKYNLKFDKNTDGMNASGVQSTLLHETLQNVEKWNTSELENLLREIANVLTKRRLRTLPSRESELLIRINQPALSVEENRQYEIFYQKLQSENIAEDEYKTLLQLIEKQENHNIERLRCLIELAQTRRLPLEVLMQQLGIQNVASYA